MNITQRAQTMNRCILLLLAFTISTTLLQAQWEYIGPMGGGVVRFCETNEGIVACTAGAGAYRSDDTGKTWTMMGREDLLDTVYNVRSIYGRLYAASNRGLYCSSDRGTTWVRKITSPSAIVDVRDVCDFKGTLYIATGYRGLFRSTDSGAVWLNVPSAPKGVYQFLVSTDEHLFAATTEALVHSATGTAWITTNTYDRATDLRINGDTVFAVVGGAIYRSSTRTPSWVLSDMFSGVINIAFDDSSTMYYVTTVNLGRARIRRGQTMAELINGDLEIFKSSAICWVDGVLLVAPEERGVYRSTDEGSTWVPSMQGLFATIVHGMSISNGIMYAATERLGLQISRDKGRSWNTHNIGENIVAIGSGERSVLYGCAEQTGAKFSVDGGITFQNIPTIDVVSSAYRSPLYVYSIGPTMFVSHESSTWRSGDDGASWQLSKGLPKAPVAAMGQSPTVLYAGTNTSWTNAGGGFFRSTDNGRTFSAINIGITEYDGVNAMLSVGDTIIVGTTKGIFRSSNDGSTWSRVSSMNTITTFHKHGDTMYAAPSKLGIAYSADRGATWTELPAAKQLSDVTTLVSDESFLYASLDRGSVARMPLQGSVSTGLPTDFAEQARLMVFPNPSFDGTVTLQCAEDVEGEIVIMNGLGIVVWRGVRTHGATTSFNTSPLLPGTYYVQCIGAARPTVTSFVVVH